ncbi:hypothetical protein D1AOALGA4SA_6812 [Olavius algarvensis Delta 1 endosymbiont]|nr:hypothetical protein D1AOALGA4SA_6812 [Olavius algarvensis Delta 1 endosymbiont]
MMNSTFYEIIKFNRYNFFIDNVQSLLYQTFSFFDIMR